MDAKGTENSVIRIGSRSLIGQNTIISCKDGDIIIGDKTPIAKLVSILWASGAYRTEQFGLLFKDQGIYSKGGIRFENNVWISTNAQILDDTAPKKGLLSEPVLM